MQSQSTKWQLPGILEIKSDTRCNSEEGIFSIKSEFIHAAPQIAACVFECMALVNDEVSGSEMRHNKIPVADAEALLGTKFRRAPLPLLPRRLSNC